MTSQDITTSDREIVVSRFVEAPRELVYRAWTEPEHIAKWFGPDGFTNTVLSMDVRVGGEWRFIMHGPDGTDYENLVIYTEVTPPERLAYDHSDWQGSISFKAVVTFEEQNGGTTVTLRTIFETAELREKMAEEVGAVEGAIQTLGRMAAYVKAM